MGCDHRFLQLIFPMKCLQVLELDEDLLKLIEDSKLPTLEYSDGEYKEQYKPFYETLFEE